MVGELEFHKTDLMLHQWPVLLCSVGNKISPASLSVLVL